MLLKVGWARQGDQGVTDRGKGRPRRFRCRRPNAFGVCGRGQLDRQRPPLLRSSDTTFALPSHGLRIYLSFWVASRRPLVFCSVLMTSLVEFLRILLAAGITASLIDNVSLLANHWLIVYTESTLSWTDWCVIYWVQPVKSMARFSRHLTKWGDNELANAMCTHYQNSCATCWKQFASK